MGEQTLVPSHCQGSTEGVTDERVISGLGQVHL
jgi:hypothetical protein